MADSDEIAFPTERDFPRGFVGWQKALMCEALNVWKSAEFDSWADVAVDISEKTGHEIGDRTLGKFAAGAWIDSETGENKGLNKRKDAHAVASYLAHEDVGAVSVEQLKGAEYNHNAPILFLVFLFGRREKVPPLSSRFQGVYTLSGDQHGADSHTFSALLQNDGLFLEISECRRRTSVDRRGRRTVLEQYSRGWAILAPENYFLFFMKDRFGKTYSYISVAAELDYFSEEGKPFFVLAKHGAPEDDLNVVSKRNKTNIGADMFMNKLKEDIEVLVFEWVSKELLSQSQDFMYNKNERDRDRDNSLGGSPFTKRTRFQKTSTEVIGKIITEKGTFLNEEITNNELGMQLLAAAEAYDTDRVEELLRGGAPVNFQHPRHGYTALHLAAGRNDRDTFRVLIKCPDIDVTLETREGYQASHLAYHGGYQGIARLLVKKKVGQLRDQGEITTERPLSDAPDPDGGMR